MMLLSFIGGLFDLFFQIRRVLLRLSFTKNLFTHKAGFLILKVFINILIGIVKRLLEGIHVDLIAPYGLIECCIEQSVVLFLKVVMSTPVQRQFTSLSKRFKASVYTANKWLLVCMCVLMFPEILRQCKHFSAVLTWEGLLPAMDVVVPF